MATAGYRGGDGKLYYEAGWDDGEDIPATPSVTLIDRAVDVSLSLSKGQANLNSRQSTWNKRGPGLKDGSISFQYRSRRGTDAVETKLRDSWVNDTYVLIYVMDDAFATSGAKGWRVPGVVQDFSLDQPLEDGAIYNVQIDAADATDASDDELDPAFITIA